MKASTRILLSLSIFGVSAASAQDISTEVVVDRTIVPVQRAATRPQTVSPQLLVPQAGRPGLDFTEYDSRSEFDPAIPVLHPAVHTALSPLSPYRGYAALGYYPAYNLGASAGYRFIAGPRTSLGASLQFDGNSYHNPLFSGADGKSTSVRNNTVSAAADFSQRIGEKSRLDVDAAYTHGARRLPDEANPENTEHLNIAGLNARWWSSAGSVSYNVRAAYSYFGYAGERLYPTGEGVEIGLEGASEHRFRIGAGAIAPLDRHRHSWIGLEIEGDILHRGDGLRQHIDAAGSDPRPLEFILLDNPRYTTSAIIGATPYFGLNYANVNARVGLDVDISAGTTGKVVHVAPDIMLDWNPSKQLAVYATFTGGESFNTLRGLYEDNPFAPAAFSFANSYAPVKARAGINVGPFYGATAEIYGGYENVRDMPMPALVDGATVGYNTPRRFTLGRYAAYMPVDISGWYAGVRLGYSWRDLLKVGAGVEVLPHSYASATTANPDRAAYVATASLVVRPLERLTIDLGYELRAGRRYYGLARTPVGNIGHSEVRMRNVSMLDAGARYAVTPAFTVFATLENLLCRQVELFPLLPSQRMHGLVGVELKF